MKTTKRRYLPASERKREILDAAFLEFSNDGFVAASLERIASRAGISKSGIYSHYKSKHEIFEDMLLTNLLPEDIHLGIPSSGNADSLPRLLDDYLEPRYASLSNPRTIAVFRLLIAESGRSPELIQQCVQKALKHLFNSDRQFLAACIRNNFTHKQIESSQILLAGSSASLWMTFATIFGEKNPPLSLEQVKAQHKKLLLELLEG